MRYIKISSLLACLFIGNAFAIEIDTNAPRTIKSDKIEYNIKSEEFRATGNTQITNSKGQQIKVNEIYLNKNTTNASGRDIELWLGSNVYVRAQDVIRMGPETIATKAMFTACDNCDSFGNTWEIHGRKIIHDSEEKMLYFHSASFWLYNGEIPIFWLPYYEMPDPSVKYKSGLLNPSFSSTNGMGLQFNVPLYINLSDRHDFTTTFSYLTNENPLFQLEHRLNLKHSEFRTNGAYTHNQEGDNRWYVDNEDIIELGNNARASIYINRTSDKTFLQKYGFYDYQPYLDSGAKLELFGQTSYVVADTHIFQELREPAGNQTVASGNILPNVRGVYQSNPIYKETYLTLSGDVLGVTSSHSSSQRIIGEGRITSPWTLWGGNRLTLSVSSRYDIYNFDNTRVYNENLVPVDNYSGVKTRFLPSAYAEWGLPLFSVKNNWTYTIEPRARLTIMEHTNTKSVFAFDNDSAGRFLTDTTLFSNNRYAGDDVWENGNFADYGMRWAAFNSDNNIEVFIGQTYDFNTTDIAFNDNGFRNGFSDYVGRITYGNNDNLQLSTRFRFDRNDMSLSHSENSIYIGRNNNYFTLGHIWNSRPIDIVSQDLYDTHEAMIGAGLQITKRINIKENVIYNIYDHFLQRHSGGIFFNHPCYYLSFEYQRDNAIKNDYVGGTTFQFRFGISIDGRHY